MCPCAATQGENHECRLSVFRLYLGNLFLVGRRRYCFKTEYFAQSEEDGIALDLQARGKEWHNKEEGREGCTREAVQQRSTRIYWSMLLGAKEEAGPQVASFGVQARQSEALEVGFTRTFGDLLIDALHNEK